MAPTGLAPAPAPARFCCGLSGRVKGAAPPEAALGWRLGRVLLLTAHADAKGTAVVRTLLCCSDMLLRTPPPSALPAPLLLLLAAATFSRVARLSLRLLAFLRTNPRLGRQASASSAVEPRS